MPLLLVFLLALASWIPYFSSPLLLLSGWTRATLNPSFPGPGGGRILPQAHLHRDLNQAGRPQPGPILSCSPRPCPGFLSCPCPPASPVPTPTLPDPGSEALPGSLGSGLIVILSTAASCLAADTEGVKEKDPDDGAAGVCGGLAGGWGVVQVCSLSLERALHTKYLWRPETLDHSLSDPEHCPQAYSRGDVRHSCLYSRRGQEGRIWVPLPFVGGLGNPGVANHCFRCP